MWSSPPAGTTSWPSWYAAIAISSSRRSKARSERSTASITSTRSCISGSCFGASPEHGGRGGRWDVVASRWGTSSRVQREKEVSMFSDQPWISPNRAAQMDGPSYLGPATFMKTLAAFEPEELDELRPDVAIVGA